MNVKEYIASGIVESYVLGLASHEEMAEFERMCAAHHEVKLAREAFEKQLEQQALSKAVKPPTHLKSKIFAELEVEADKRKTNGATFTADTPEIEETPIVSMRWWKIATAAAVILLIGSVAMNIYYRNQANNFRDLYVAAQSESAKRDAELGAQMTAYRQVSEMIRDTNMIAIQMPGTKDFPASRATVYWDKRSKDVFLVVNNLPQPVPGKQYQLWAMVNGQPVDAGMLEWKDATLVARMKNIPVAQGFAITLENEGGSPTPDMSALHVIKMI